jgi:predicted porin
MQKKLLTMAVAGALAAPVAALAQVTVYGSFDAGIKNQSKVIVGGADDSVLSVDGQIKKTNRWGLKGSDDLGGGLMANFVLEGGFTADTGQENSASGATGIFNRRSIVGLSKGGNSVNLGREYTLNFKTQGIYDPLSHDYGGSAGIQGGVGTAGVRVGNSVTGEFRFGTGGVGVQMGMGEQAGPAAAGDYTAFNADFAFGPVTVGAAFGTLESTATTDTTTTSIGGAYKMGAFTFRLGMGTQELDGGNESQKLSGGVQYDFSPTLTGRVSFYDQGTDNAAGTEIGTSESFIVNVEYSLSKTTLVYAVFDRKGFTGADLAASAVADGATAIGAGIVVNF